MKYSASNPYMLQNRSWAAPYVTLPSSSSASSLLRRLSTSNSLRSCSRDSWTWDCGWTETGDSYITASMRIYIYIYIIYVYIHVRVICKRYVNLLQNAWHTHTHPCIHIYIYTIIYIYIYTASWRTNKSKMLRFKLILHDNFNDSKIVIVYVYVIFIYIYIYVW